tara:strand:+ start:1260 stop:1385 length:126 start_codon:yes stop_codon:yes gene_type:complete
MENKNDEKKKIEIAGMIGGTIGVFIGFASGAGLMAVVGILF